MPIIRPAVTVFVALALLGACASPRTKAQHRAALDACVASPDPARSVDCERADILRDQMEYEKAENTQLALGAFAVSVLTLGFISVLDDDCCYYRNHGYYGRYGHRHRGYYRGGDKVYRKRYRPGRGNVITGSDGTEFGVTDNIGPRQRARGVGERANRRR